MVDKSTNSQFEKIYERLREAIEVKSIRQLAEILGKNHTTILSAKEKDNFPANWAYEIEKKYGLLTGWIMTGKGPKRLNEGVEINPLLVEVNEWLNEEKKHKSPNFRILFEEQMIRAFFDYEKWQRKRDEREGSGSVFTSSKVA